MGYSQVLSVIYPQHFAKGTSLLAPPKSPTEGPAFNPKAAPRAAGPSIPQPRTPISMHPPPISITSIARGGPPALTQMKGDVDRVGVLDAESHGLALPPSALLLAVEVSEEGSVVVAPGVGGIAAVAQGAGVAGAHLQAVVLRGGTARVGGLDGPAKGSVLKDRHAAAGLALGVPAGG